MCVFLSASRMARALGGLALVLAGVGAAAQAQFTLNGVDYELVTWPVANDIPTLTSDTWSLEFGNGHIEVVAAHVRSNPVVVGDFFNSSMHQGAGYAITQTPQFYINKGQRMDGSDTVAIYTISASKLPTELIFYAGGSNGLKYARWQWGSTQAGTKFEVLIESGTFDVVDNGTSTMSWRTFGADNNTAMALVRITNSAGISNFSVVSNRLDASGNLFHYSNDSQRADLSDMAILVRRPVALVSPQAIPTLGTGALALLLAALGGIGAWFLRHRGGTLRWMNVGTR